MSRYFRGAFGAADSKGDFTSFVSDLKYAMSVAREDLKTIAEFEKATSARGSLPRNKYYQAGRGPSISTAKDVIDAKASGATSPGVNKLLLLLGDWTGTPFEHKKYQALADYLPKAGSSGFETAVKDIMMTDKELVLRYSAKTGCWTMGFGPQHRALIDEALIEARRQIGFLTSKDIAKAPLDDVFDKYFGFWKSGDKPTVEKVKSVFRALHADMVGSNRCRLIMAPPGAKAGARASGRDTLAFVRADTWPKEKGAMIFLGKQFFVSRKSMKDRAATLIHEATHYFADTVDEDEDGTEDQCYGDENCKRMADLVDDTDAGKRALAAVLNNAESYCLFAYAATK